MRRATGTGTVPAIIGADLTPPLGAGRIERWFSFRTAVQSEAVPPARTPRRARPPPRRRAPPAGDPARRRRHLPRPRLRRRRHARHRRRRRPLARQPLSLLPRQGRAPLLLPGPVARSPARRARWRATCAAARRAGRSPRACTRSPSPTSSAWSDEVEGSAAHLEVDALPARLRARIVAKRDRYERGVRALVAAGIRRGDLGPTDPTVATRAFLGALNWTAHWFRPDGPQPAERSPASSPTTRSRG